jgi:hypothetical protein
MSHGSAAKAAREAKERHPEQFCPVGRCLWRTGGGRCPKHPGTIAQELAEMETRDPKLKALGDRINAMGEQIAGVQPACGPCADKRNLVLTAGYPAATCVFCGGPTGRRLNAYNGGDTPNR